MRQQRLGSIFIYLTLLINICLLLSRPVCADSLNFLFDTDYEVTNTETTDKGDGSRVNNERATFSQLYSLDIQKEIFPTLKLNVGGLFDQDSSRTKTNDPAGQDTNTRNTAIRPFIDLQFSTSLLQAAMGYRKNEIKRSSSTIATDRNFTEEYSTHINWEPVDLPEVALYFTRNLAYDEPKTNDQQIDNYQLRSKYAYRNFAFSYNHTTNDALNKVADFKTLTNSDDGTIRFSKLSRQGKVSVNSSLRASRQKVEFSGTGERLVATSSVGTVIGNSNDPVPTTSSPEDGFSLTAVDLLVDSPAEAKLLSFGLDFGTSTDVDRLFVNFTELGNISSSDFSWNVYVRDNATENWTQITPVTDTTNVAENRFELAFNSVETRFIKIVTTPLAPPTVVAGQELLIGRLEGRRTLPANTSEFVTTDWTADLFLNWKLTNKTTVGYDMLYREQRSQPLDEKKTLLSTGARMRHTFNDVFVGNMRVQRSESQQRSENPITNHSYSAALAAKYLDTFNQNLTYSFSHQNDEDNRTNISNAIFLRSNLDLYQGWSMYLDNGYSWQNPAEGENLNTTFVRASSNIVPNRWLNTTVSYGVSWVREKGRPVSQDQNSRIVVSLVPTSSLSLSADFSFTDKTGEIKDSSADQQYFINWSPFRDGTLFFSLAYGQSENDDDDKAWSLSPTLRWQVNRKTLLTFDYAVGEREDETKLVSYENIGLALRIFY